VLVSTATKTLQDQLFGRDLPRLAQALGVPVRTALLKGRGSYLCAHRLDLARQDPAAGDRAVAAALAKVERWAQATRSGDLGELAGLDDRSPVIPLVTSTRENCLGSACPKFRTCHVNQARREALAADVVVINHHLFFADLAVRESGMAELLPTVRVAIFDEAHQLNETGVQFLGAQLGTGQLLDVTRDMLAAGICSWRAAWSTGSNAPRRSSAPRATCGWPSAAAPQATACAGPVTRPKESTHRPGPRAWRPSSKRWTARSTRCPPSARSPPISSACTSASASSPIARAASARTARRDRCAGSMSARTCG
jgi:Rad3-related DNA helicase